MKVISCDIETYSSADLSKSGVYHYAEAQDFKVLLFGYAVDNGPVKVVDLAHGERIPEIVINALTDPTIVKWAHNAVFERICLSRMLGLSQGSYLDPAQWRCSMVWAATLGLPQSLEDVGAVLDLQEQKLTEGKSLIRKFCIQGKTARSDDTTWMDFIDYNRRDVEVEIAIQEMLSAFPVPESVWEQYWIDQKINDRGVLTDTEFVRQALVMDALSRAKLTAEMQSLTNVNNPNSITQLKKWLSYNGVEVQSLDKKAIGDLLQTVPENLHRPLQLHMQLH